MERYLRKLKRLITKKDTGILIIIIFAGAILRLYNLDWDSGHFIHPDERLYVNASKIFLPKSFSELFSQDSPLNPNMFYYGTFPLYLYKFVNYYLLNFLSFAVASRLVSSFFSILTIPLIYLVSRNFLSRKESLISSIVFAFAAGSIQYAHFNTTESILVFLESAALLISIKFAKLPNYKYALLLGVILGLSYGTKITALVFIFFPLIALLLALLSKKNLKKIAFSVVIFLVTAPATGVLFSIYQVVNAEQFIREQKYMQSIILGSQKAPFTIIYENTIPYLYQVLNILPFTFGFISVPAAFMGLVLIARKVIKKRKIESFELFIVAFPLIYFIWAGAWYAKFSRYYILLLPFLSVLAAYAISKLEKRVQILIITLIIINGLLFARIYLYPNTRIEASTWIYKNIQPQKAIVGEHWDDNLPLPIQGYPHNWRMSQLAVYDPETDGKILNIASALSESDYFIISSRRVSYSILVNRSTYPYTSRLYGLLESGGLGFKKIKVFERYPYLFSDDMADESFQSYDHPPVTIYENEKRLPKELIYQRLKNGR